MAKIKPLPGSLDNLPKSRGVYYVRNDPKRGYIATAWPRYYLAKKGLSYQQYRILEFSFASSLASNNNTYDYQSLKAMAEGTAFTWRDMMIQAEYGYLYNFRGIDGTVWTPWRMAQPNPQQVLDLITDVVGSVLYRSSTGWVGIDPGTDGFMLTTHGPNADPTWEKPPASTGAATNLTTLQNWDATFQNSKSIAAGYWSGCCLWLPKGLTITGIREYVSGNNTNTITPYLLSTNQPGLVGGQVATGPSVSNPVDGWNDLPLAGQYVIPNDGFYQYGTTNSGAGYTIPTTGRNRFFVSTVGTNSPIQGDGMSGSSGGWWLLY